MQALTKVDNLSLTKLLPDEEGNGPQQIEGKLKAVESQRAFLCCPTALPPD